MTVHNKGKITELEIVRVASRMFLEEGYSKTTIRAIASELDISPGHLMFSLFTGIMLGVSGSNLCRTCVTIWE